ncbi:ribonuclease HII [Sneathiella litorea]|uniref:Ribonuclease HII n=1 Tax=Sneathiella litorea TaxID=2606216 RepID=A0A6L8W2Q2_9PROT|nr:ribonuclease HII [Sneathiella litorea]MZR29201.1 ribonuclease HII [Sneathiella litorea]
MSTYNSNLPDFSFEIQETGRIAGVDEVGRGPFAGPVVAAAVILDPENIPVGLQDSKKVSKVRREKLYDDIYHVATVGIGEASVQEIDRLNILQASLLAMRRAVAALPNRPDVALVDGNKDPKLGLPTRLIVKGDSRSLSIAAASIVAKVTRDRKMCALAEKFPHYGWEKNAGYGTAEHRKGLIGFGVTPQHRRSFAPIRALLNHD